MPDPDPQGTYDVRFADETKKEFRDLGHSARVDILSAVQKKLTTKPLEYGEPLGRDLAGYRKLPVGQWRVVYFVEERKVLVLVLAIGKRAAGDRVNIYDQISRAEMNARREALTRRVEQETGNDGGS
ncbi:MAG: type II toxin-antitoxin system RelE/ParE family toxin [Gemmatimonadetes bacterium]|nr:type II toxin-antitoxin system RelE/ParE family toxin [Gemmatimonadota bacterium]